MKRIQITQLDLAAARGKVRRFTVLKCGEQYLLEVQLEGDKTAYTLYSQRRLPRTWRDPRYIFQLLETRFNVKKGAFEIRENIEVDDETTETDPD